MCITMRTDQTRKAGRLQLVLQGVVIVQTLSGHLVLKQILQTLSAELAAKKIAQTVSGISVPAATQDKTPSFAGGSSD